MPFIFEKLIVCGSTVFRMVMSSVEPSEKVSVADLARLPFIQKAIELPMPLIIFSSETSWAPRNVNSIHSPEPSPRSPSVSRITPRC